MSKKSVIVLGLACSGTSLIAGILHCIGINMNPPDNALPGYPYGSFEDEEMQAITKLLCERKLRRSRNMSINNVCNMAKRIIRERNRKNSLWGFKSALTYRCLDHLMPYFKNPHFVIIFRNPLTNALSFQRQQSKNFARVIDVNNALSIIANELSLLISKINKYNEVPKIFFEKERVENEYLKTIIDLSRFLNIKIDLRKLEGLLKVYVKEDRRDERKGLSQLLAL